MDVKKNILINYLIEHAYILSTVFPKNKVLEEIKEYFEITFKNSTAEEYQNFMKLVSEKIDV